MIQYAVPARVGLLGNPSDGYGGRTISLALDQFAATVSLTPSETIQIVPADADLPTWASIGELVDAVDAFGVGTGVELLVATIRTFVDVAESVEHRRPTGFTLRYDTTIPRQLGLAGSSALVIATLRCLSDFTRLEIPDEVLPSIALRVETERLGISAGLQDRVVQTYGGLVAMDFGSMEVDARFGVSHGRYERLDPSALPSLFLAYRPASAGPSGIYHGELGRRFAAGDGEVREGLRALAGLVSEGKAALRWGNRDLFARLMGQNMSIRRTLAPIPAEQLELVEVADSLEAPATFTGSGGAVVGAYADDAHLETLVAGFGQIGAHVLPIGGCE